MSLVLIIEDNRASMKLMVQILCSKGHEVLEARDAESGLALARANHPDVVVMDVQLPGKDGLTAVRELRNDVNISNIPVLVVTARGMLSERERIESGGGDAYLLKPINYRVFLSTIERLVAERTA